MPAPVMPADADPAPGATAARDLPALRAELDRLDEALHAMILRRAEIVAEVGTLPDKGPVALRPGREAAILRRLLARHAGPFPAAWLLSAWRNLLAGSTAQQRPLRVAVCAPAGEPDHVALAREHFGPLVPLQAFATPAQAMHEVSQGQAVAALLPLPQAEEAARDAWWTSLLHRDAPRLHIVARLPLWTARPEGAPQAEAFVVTAAEPDPSGLDRALLGLELPATVSRARLSTELAAAGLQAVATILRREAEHAPALALVEVAGFVTEADPRLAALNPLLLRPPMVLGAYAVPLES